MAANCTHAQIVVGGGLSTTAEQPLGTVELPVRTNGWKIHNLFGQVVRQTATAAEFIGGHFRIFSPSGDVAPDPAPSRWPCYERGSFLGASAPVSNIPMFNYPVDLDAAGKANITFNAVNDIACTVAPIWTCGLAYGPDIVQPFRYKFVDRMRSTQSAIARTQVGTINLSEKATRITGIMGVLKQDGVLVTAEELMGFFDLSSDDVDMIPSQWCFNEVHGAGLGTVIGGGNPFPPMPHAVDIPVVGGARIDGFITLQAAVTNPANVAIYVFYE